MTDLVSSMRMELRVPSARRSLICAAAVGWKGDEISPWPCPQSEETLLAWAKSFGKELSQDALEWAFQELVDENLFRRVLYPVFTIPVFYCSFETSFLDELSARETLDALKTTKEEMRAFWNELVDRYMAFGPAWVYWGLCHGQGSEGPSDSPYGPCLGPSCSSCRRSRGKCNWELPLVAEGHWDWPDLSFLQTIHENAVGDWQKHRASLLNAIAHLKARSPERRYPVRAQHTSCMFQ